MHLYLRLVNESGESVIEQVPKEDFLVFYKYYSLKSYVDAFKLK